MAVHSYRGRPLRQVSIYRVLILFILLWTSGFSPWLLLQPKPALAYSGDHGAVPVGSTPLSGLTWQGSPPDSCFSIFGSPISIPQVYVSAAPDLGGAGSTVLVTVGRIIHLSGIAELIQIGPDCNLQVQPLPFAWTLAFQSAGGLPADATATLQNASTLTPTFNTVQVGTYFAQLVAGRTSARVRIEVLRSGRSWYSIGPNGSGGPTGKDYTAVGRLNALTFDPGNPATLYAGSALGGVWKSLDRGGSWFPMSDHKGLPTLGVGALAVAPDGTVYEGTGDLNPNDDGITQGGSGIWKSTDGGVTWQPAGTTIAANCPSGSVAFTGQATRIQINSQNPAMVYVAAVNGLFRSTDGGRCWKQVLFSSNGIGVTDIAMDPTNPSIMYAAIPQVSESIFKSTNADAPTPLFGPLMQLPVVDKYTRIVLAIAPSTTSTIYVALSFDNFKPSPEHLTYTDVLKSTDGGAHWTQGQRICMSQCPFNTALAVSPVDPNRVVYGEVTAWQSTDGTQSWIPLGVDPGHTDFHALVFAPDNPSMLYAANDGGVYRITLPPSNNPTTTIGWEPRNLDLTIAQAPSVALSPTDPQTAALGLWDNGTLRRDVGRSWQAIGGGDGFNVAIDAASHQAIYYNPDALNGGTISRYPDATDSVIGTTNGFVSNPYRPGEFFGTINNGPADPNNGGKPTLKLYVSESTNFVSQVDWRCADPTPVGIVNSPALEFGPDGSYYVGQTDGSLYHFTLPLSPSSGTQCAQGLTAAQGATPIYTTPSKTVPVPVVDPFNPQSLYIVVPGGSGANRVLRLSQTNGNWTATPLAGALPNDVSPSGPIGADPLASGVLYLGTQHGLWEGTPQSDGTYTWTLDPDVPDTWIFGIVAQRSSKGYSGILRLTTYGRGVWERHISLSFRCLRSCIPPTIHCISCLYEAENPGPFIIKGPNPADGEAWITVPYTYRGEGGSSARVRVVPLANGVEQPYFISQAQQVGVGDGTAVLPVIYAASNAPMGLHTDALRLELLGGSNDRIITSTTVPFDKWWLRPETRLLTVDAEVTDPGSLSIPVALTIQIGQGTFTRGNSPLTVPVPVGAKVTVQIPAKFKVHLNTRYFNHWTTNGILAGTEASMIFTITEDMTLTAHYTDSRPQQPPGSGLPDWLKILLFILLFIALLVLALVLFLQWRRRYKMRM